MTNEGPMDKVQGKVKIKEKRKGLGKPVYVSSELTFKVGSILLVDNIAFGNLINGAYYLGQHIHCFLLIGSRTQSSHHVPHGDFLIPVLQPLLSILTGSFRRRFMVCHVPLFQNYFSYLNGLRYYEKK